MAGEARKAWGNTEHGEESKGRKRSVHLNDVLHVFVVDFEPTQAGVAATNKQTHSTV